VRVFELPSVSGLASSGGGFFVTSMSNGDPVGGDVQNWDNHLTKL
jgi:hypothetical protein